MRHALLTWAAVLTAACQHNGAPQAGDDPTPSVTFDTARGEASFTVDIADTPEERAVGLMYRREMEPRHGMLFIFPSESEHEFWMRNTYLSLDMIFLDADKKVVGVVAQAEPLTETPRGVGAPSKYVVEILGGLAAERGIESGIMARFADVPESTGR